MCDMDWEMQVPIKDRDGQQRQLLVGPIRMTRIGAASVLQRIPSAIPTWAAQGDEAGIALRLPCPFSAQHITGVLISSFEPDR